MNQFNKAQVIMLPTDTILASNFGLITTNVDTLLLVNNNTIGKVIESLRVELQHLYIISDDEIKEGDYKYNSKTNCIGKHNREGKGLPDELKKASEWCKKIIATTDISLANQCIRKDHTLTNNYSNVLPQPSQQFITKYIESYNKGEVNTDVLVEYESSIIGQCNCICHKPGYTVLHCFPCCHPHYIDSIKINPKDNTITIKQLKVSWNKEEVIENMWLAYKESNTIFVNEASTRREFDRWITKIL